MLYGLQLQLLVCTDMQIPDNVVALALQSLQRQVNQYTKYKYKVGLHKTAYTSHVKDTKSKYNKTNENLQETARLAR